MLNLIPRVMATAVFLTAVAMKAAYPATEDTAQPQNNAAAQTSQTPTLKVTTRIVVLDVVVTDKKGNLVSRELTRDDFIVLEDGQHQVIRNFEPPSEHHMPVSDKAIVNSAADLKKIGDAPVTVSVLDELNSRFEDMSFSRALREGMRLNFRVEGFNVFNTPNLGQPQATSSCSTTSMNGGSCPAAGGSYPLIVGSATSAVNFGSIRSTFGNNGNTSTNGRKLQFAATVFF